MATDIYWSTSSKSRSLEHKRSTRAAEFNELLKELTSDQRETLTEEIKLRGLRLVRNGIEMAVEPYGTEMYYDWTCRRAGDAWPEHQLDEKYKS